jgi:hypothetical protein
MEYTEKNFDSAYCEKCEVRRIVGGKPGKDSPNCPAGRKNHPKSLRATLNLLKNNGTICSHNPARVHYGITDLKHIAGA